ncbi:MAG: hypothetical protein KGR26_14375 [Cyanobacteria bacterium REEB65]|nr:hypothetical protein [Cyanobacteria bacterium REEB65]
MLAIVLVLGIGLGYGLHGFAPGLPIPSPFGPDGEDPRFERAGEKFAAELPGDYARVWVRLAHDMETGRPFGQSVKHAERTWDLLRRKRFDHEVHPLLARIVPDGTADEKVTVSQRQAVADAARSFAKGLNGGRLPEPAEEVADEPAKPAPVVPSLPPIAKPDFGKLAPPRPAPDAHPPTARIVPDDLKPIVRPAPNPQPTPARSDVGNWEWKVAWNDEHTLVLGRMEADRWVRHQPLITRPRRVARTTSPPVSQSYPPGLIRPSIPPPIQYQLPRISTPICVGGS